VSPAASQTIDGQQEYNHLQYNIHNTFSLETFATWE